MTIASISISDIITQTLILFLLIGLGYLFAKTKYLPESSGVVLSKLVIKAAMPATILVKMLGADFTREDYINGIYIYVFAIIFLFVDAWHFVVCIKSHKLSDKLKVSMQSGHVWKRGVLCTSAFPGFVRRGRSYLCHVFQHGKRHLLWSVGIFMVNRHKERDIKKNLKHMINANTIAFCSEFCLW